MSKKKMAHHHRLLPIRDFLKRMLLHLSIGFLIILVSLILGVVGYEYFESMNVVDAYVNAAMILSGMGPVQELQTEAGKIFAGTYALFSGIVFLVVIAIFIAPLFHRFLHNFMIKDVK